MVRDAAAEALGTMLKVVGERTMGVFLDGVDDIKMAKVRTYVCTYMCVCTYVLYVLFVV